MTKKKLMKALEHYPDDTQIYLSADAEGNGYEELREASEVIPKKVHGDMEFYVPEWTAYDNGLEEDEWEKIKKNGKLALILWP